MALISKRPLPESPSTPLKDKSLSVALSVARQTKKSPTVAGTKAPTMNIAEPSEVYSSISEAILAKRKKLAALEAPSDDIIAETDDYSNDMFSSSDDDLFEEEPSEPAPTDMISKIRAKLKSLREV